MKHPIILSRLDIETIIINRIKGLFPDVTNLSIAWVKKDVVVYMDASPKKVNIKKLRS